MKFREYYRMNITNFDCILDDLEGYINFLPNVTTYNIFELSNIHSPCRKNLIDNAGKTKSLDFYVTSLDKTTQGPV